MPLNLLLSSSHAVELVEAVIPDADELKTSLLKVALPVTDNVVSELSESAFRASWTSTLPAALTTSVPAVELMLPPLALIVPAAVIAPVSGC